MRLTVVTSLGLLLLLCIHGNNSAPVRGGGGGGDATPSSSSSSSSSPSPPSPPVTDSSTTTVAAAAGVTAKKMPHELSAEEAQKAVEEMKRRNREREAAADEEVRKALAEEVRLKSRKEQNAHHEDGDLPEPPHQNVPNVVPDHDEDDFENLPYDEDDEYLYSDEDLTDYQDYAEDEAEAAELKNDADEEYQRYLDEMTQEMLDDPDMLAEILKEIGEMKEEEKEKEDHDLFAIAKHLKAKEQQNLRSRGEEHQREVIERQRRAAKREEMRELGLEKTADEHNFRDKDGNIHNVNEIRQIAEKRVKALGSIDKQRHAAFVQREMHRELEFRRKLHNPKLTSEQRAKLREEHRQALIRLKTHKGHMPGGQQQLSEVWDQEDGFRGLDFEPHIFFKVHDVNADGKLDIKEIEALMWKEASELHTLDDGAIDNDAAHEEMAIMREYVIDKSDANGDAMIDLQEFVELTKMKDWEDDVAWDALFPDFSEEELKKFEIKDKRARNTQHKEHVNPAEMAAARRAKHRMAEEHEEHKIA